MIFINCCCDLMKNCSNYKNGKIYIIRFTNDDDHIYIGSTITSLKLRFSQHKSCSTRIHKTSIASYINKTYNNDWNNCCIELLCNYPCATKKQLEKKEYQLINKYARKNKFVLNIKGNKYVLKKDK